MASPSKAESNARTLCNEALSLVGQLKVRLGETSDGDKTKVEQSHSERGQKTPGIAVASAKKPAGLNMVSKGDGSETGKEAVKDGTSSGVMTQDEKAALRKANKAAKKQKKEGGGKKKDEPKKAPQESQEIETSTMAGEKSKAELRRERRAAQESQRAAKDQKKSETAPREKKDISIVTKTTEAERKDSPKRSTHSPSKETRKLGVDSNKAAAESGGKPITSIGVSSTRRLQLFSHLVQHEKRTIAPPQLMWNKAKLHPAVATVGLQISQGLVQGSNARALAMLHAFKKVL
ncbi:unnamed protein product [Darwinula stevensoni]|uniref:Uncharacterized protein n=1 Tax=Darwinula stevensoni TaxID=69355 RepID=A0A7R8XAE5_9CRUS|nr:unnamed protein product [Darwinula stevensoni]CAG0890588.1 unnamed protein product [Darwinula stevensoni]